MRSPRRAPSVVVLAVSLLLPVAGPAAADPAAADPAVVSPLAPALNPYFAQELAWGPCTDLARTDVDREAYANPQYDCAYLEVPLDYGDPSASTARIAMLRQKALDPAARVGSLFVDPGGPGGSGVSFLPALAGLLGDGEVARRFDLIGFDPRGVGVSEPSIDCSTTEEVDAERADLDLDTSPEGVAQTEAEFQEFADRCADRVGLDVLENVGTRDVARDLQIAHEVVGDPQLTYLGYSYGTSIGTEFAEQFPTEVRALVLDGAVDPSLDPVASRTTQTRGFQRAFDSFAASCAAQPDCPLGTDAAGASAQVQELLTPLIDAPVPTADGGRVLGYADAVTGMVQALYADSLWPPLLDGLRQVARGDGTNLLILADLYYDRAPDGSYGNLLEAFPAISCMDGDRLTDRAVAREVNEANLALAPFLDAGYGSSDVLELCSFWPVPPTSDSGPVGAPGLPPVLVASSTGDPATPYEDGVSLARQLSARLLSVDNDGHTVVLQGVNACADEVTTRYLVDLVLPPTDTTCARPPAPAP
ncbi:alpha/beta fold hydrolase [Pseudonocardia sp. KRD-184]|uniref:Alpha/beta fold hydrolase n=1 Tax=Pseudonocardia oceani TaxID=2792013 RepID=A0ABS6U4W1_9PSEU|nr:alpha/beta hydrolase [Pseudonocardia oceani]MBW0091286.1 alpha/beta fold hydrolase [Pseudonocardia oceani]MBW0095596.1 alpha/beta fold hydrolase [Pseudonocardia oceani]MBW0121357.1 alpha/beta fold hydrolase [Pseudonocardia oceani]MBW0127267.1 alpha/beta fold hydrolase [Pseudonocardia oceani]